MLAQARAQARGGRGAAGGGKRGFFEEMPKLMRRICLLVCFLAVAVTIIVAFYLRVTFALVVPRMPYL